MSYDDILNKLKEISENYNADRISDICNLRSDCYVKLIEKLDNEQLCLLHCIFALYDIRETMILDDHDFTIEAIDVLIKDIEAYKKGEVMFNKNDIDDTPRINDLGEVF